MDKVIKKGKKKITITNDGATILEEANLEGEIRKMIKELSIGQDQEAGDGTTGVVVLTGALLEQAEKLIQKGIHPSRICEGFEHANDICMSYLEIIAESLGKQTKLYQDLLAVASTAVNSKVINRSRRRLAEICTKAVLAVSDLDRRDVNLDLIKIEGKIGGSLENTCLVNGIVIDKEFSHHQMPKEIRDVRMCIVTSPLEPPKAKIKQQIEIENLENFKDIQLAEKNFFKEMISQIKNCGANLLFCQWGFDDEGNHLLLRNKIPAVRWVSGSDIELLAMATGAQISPRFNEITTSSLGFAGKVRECIVGTDQERILIVEACSLTKSITIFLRGGSQLIINEAKRAIRDALCAVRNLIRDNRLLAGGGSTEMACSIQILNQSEKIEGLKHYILRAFSEALKVIPFVLAENSGFHPIEALSTLQGRQIIEKNPYLGIDCHGNLVSDLRKKGIFETLITKQQQIQAAVQITCAILRIDDILYTKKKF
mmetsp:Transcript_14033/g.27890  ORF Transcript_14033/g.27890 Transcript_14033/m.27890 type:complete len:485 (+) Transcript_14033:64-1518(+)